MRTSCGTPWRLAIRAFALAGVATLHIGAARAGLPIAPAQDSAPAPAHAPPVAEWRERGDALSDLFRPPVGRARRVTSGSSDLSSNADFVPLAAGAEMVLARLKGPGVITHLWINAESVDPYYPRMVVLRALWDGETAASVEAPIGDFFGVGHGLERDVNTEVVRVSGDGRARNCWWPMPFDTSADLLLRNDSAHPIRYVAWQVDWTELPTGFGKGLRTFHAHFRASPRDPGSREHRVADLRGCGHYVGTVLSIDSSEEGWPGEGDDRFFIDGEQLPSIQGTGTEDYFGDGWGFHEGTGPFGGTTLFEGFAGGARSSACRWHLRDPISFEKSLKVSFERAGWALRDGVMKVTPDRFDAFSSVAFWYQEEPHAPLPAMPSPTDRLPFFEIRLEPEETRTFRTLSVPDETVAPTVQQDRGLAYGGQILFAPKTLEQAQLTLPLTSPSAHTWDFFVRCTTSFDYGTWQLLLDGVPLGNPLDLYSPQTHVRETLLGRRGLGIGDHSLVFKCTGRNLESSGYSLGLDSVMLRSHQ